MNAGYRNLSAICVFAVASAVGAQTQDSAQTAQTQQAEEAAQREQVRKEAEETAQAIAAYTAARRDEALQRAKAAADDIDRRIQKLQTELDRNGGRMSAAVRDRRERTLAELRRQRIELATWYGGMQHSSTEAWSKVKDGFVRSYRTLTDAVREARDEFDRKPPAEPEEEPATEEQQKNRRD